MDIYSSECFRGCLFVCWIEDELGRKWEGGRGRGPEVRPINKQRIDCLPLSAVAGKAPGLAPSGRPHLHLR